MPKHIGLPTIVIMLMLGFGANNLAYAGQLEDADAAYQRHDYATALKIWRPMAEQGKSAAQHNLGIMYDNGQGVAQTYSEAAKWYRKAAEQGDAKGQFNLGFMYRYGQGVARNYTEAVKWFRLAAEQGVPEAQLSLGTVYYTGEGVTQDYSQALKSFRGAAALGNADAQNNLGSMYHSGKGLTQDYLRAYMWYHLTGEHGEPKSIDNRDELAKQMTPAQIAQAQEMARKCEASHYKNCD